MQADLFTALTPRCGDCCNLGDQINPGVNYCWGALVWRGPEERVEGCGYRGRSAPRPEPVEYDSAAAIHDLLTHPRHSISAKGRKWLRAQARALTKDASPADAAGSAAGSVSHREEPK